MIVIPKEYTLSKFFQFSGKPEKTGKNYRASCPNCREGNSWLIKKRLYFFPESNSFYCHNCNTRWSAYKWLTEVCRLSFQDIKYDLKDDTFEVFDKIEEEEEQYIPVLPKDCINLSDHTQLNYYKDNKIVQHALQTIEQRLLNKAPNRPKTFYVSLVDFKYKKRLIIPFFDEDGQIEYFTGRALLKNQTPKFLNKRGEKKIFNLHLVNEDIPFIYIFEGPIDAMFVENGIAISGIHLSEEQEREIKKKFPNHKLIWVLDNPRLDEASRKTLLKKMDEEEVSFFLYSNEYSSFKDINDYCIRHNVSQITSKEMQKYIGHGKLDLFKL